MALQQTERRSRRLSTAALTIAACLLAYGLMGAQPAGANGPKPAAIPCCEVVPPTRFETGPDSDDLKVFIVGERLDTIEAYFKTEYFYRETFPNTSLLGAHRIALAKKNKVGTFAVQIGDGSTVRAYGWRSSQEKPLTYDIAVDPSCGVHMEWVTDRIIKVTHGPGLTKSTVVRFNGPEGADKAWTELFKN
jgi:hypothetical protein